MPEDRSSTEDRDLDAAFDDLVSHVGTRSRRPGADLAVRTATRRRAATTATAAVVALALVVGLGGWTVQSLRQGVPVTAPPTTSTPTPGAPPTAGAPTGPGVPLPTLMTPELLDEASTGWVSWQDGSSEVTDVVRCLAEADPSPAPVRTQRERYRSGQDAVATLLRFRFASATDSNLAMRAAVEEAQACPTKTRIGNSDVTADLEVVAFTWGPQGRGGALWLVNHGDRMDVLQVVGTRRPSDEVRTQVAYLVAADVQVP